MAARSPIVAGSETLITMSAVQQPSPAPHGAGSAEPEELEEPGKPGEPGEAKPGQPGPQSEAARGTEAWQDPANSEATQQESTDPWERFGWLMATIWLLFLGYAIANVVTSDVPLWAQVLGVAAIVAFAAVYIIGFIRVGRAATQADRIRVGITHLALMVLLTGSLIPLLGIWTLSMTPFIVALAMFVLPLMWAGGVAAAIIAVALISSLATDALATTWFFIPIIAMVGAGNGLVRYLEQRQASHRAMEEERQLMAERDRVARDVHDVLGHSLTVITVKAELAERLIDADPEAAKAELAQIRSMTRESLAEIRATVAGLRVARLGDELEHAGAALRDAGIEAEVPDEVDVVDPRHRLVLGWVLREAVTNVVRHSRASRCTVQLGSASLVVIDDGVGPGHAATSPSGGLSWGRRSGTGLTGVAERVRGAGGTLSITAADGGGTRLEVHW